MPDSPPIRWTRKHLLGLEELSADEIRFVLDTADSFKEVSTRSVKKVPALRGRVGVTTIRERLGKSEWRKVAIVGDIVNSRVARSNLWGLTKLGAQVVLVGPPTLVPRAFETFGAKVVHDFDSVIGQVDVVNMLRVQFE